MNYLLLFKNMTDQELNDYSERLYFEWESEKDEVSRYALYQIYTMAEQAIDARIEDHIKTNQRGEK